MGLLQEGDWVQFRLDGRNYKGWVSHIDQVDESYCIRYLDEGAVDRVYRSMGSVHALDASLLKEDIYGLMNLAVDVNDKEWFKELGSRITKLERFAMRDPSSRALEKLKSHKRRSALGHEHPKKQSKYPFKYDKEQ